MKPIIGVMPLWNGKKKNIWMVPGYADGIMQAGGIPIIFPFTQDEEDLDQLVRTCDGFLFTGGEDVSPEMYHEVPREELVVCCEKRDALESKVLAGALSANKPILGICRGIQLINAALGGTLYQDIKTQYPSDTDHNQLPPYDRPVHKVTIDSASPLYEALKTEQLAVNSLHHQAVKITAPGLKVMARAEDGLTEALYMPGHRFLWAVQWHPELSFRSDANSRKIFGALVEAAKGSEHYLH